MANQFTFPGSTNGINMADSLSTPFSLNGQIHAEIALEDWTAQQVREALYVPTH